MERGLINLKITKPVPFLGASGRTASLLSAFNWASSPVGSTVTWSPALCNSLGIMLHSHLPMCLFWGPDLFFFFNDAFCAELPAPAQLHCVPGLQPQELWKESWKKIRVLMDAIKTGANFPVPEMISQLHFPSDPAAASWGAACTVIQDNPGQPAGLFISYNPVEDRPKVAAVALREAELQQSEEQLRSLVNSAPFPIGVYIGRELKIEILNDAILSVWGRTREVIGKRYADVLTELEGLGIYEQLDSVFMTGKPFHARNQRVDLLVEGVLKQYYFNYSFTPLYDRKGKIYAVMNTAADVTDLAMAMQKIENSEKEFRQLADSLPAFVWTTDHQGKQTFASSRWEEFTGMNPFDMDTFQKMIHPDDFDQVISTWKSCLKNGNVYKTEARVRNKNGNYYWFYVNGEPVRDQRQVIVKWIGTFFNIDEQKRAEYELSAAFQKLEESEKRFKHVADSAPVLVWMSDTSKGCHFFNKAWLNFTGRTMEEEYGDGWAENVHPDDLERCQHNYFTAFDKQEEFYMEYRLRRHDGQYRWLSDHGVPRITGSGIFEGYIGACMDIHETVLHQKNLKEKEERLNLVIEASGLGTWDLNMATGEGVYSQRLLDIFGLPGAPVTKHEDLLHYIHPTDRQSRNAALEKAIQTGILHFAARIIRSDHSIRWIESRGKVFYDQQHQPIKLIGTVRDTTEDRLQAAELQEREQKFRLLADSMPQYIWTVDASGNLNYCNQSLLQFSGLEAANIFQNGLLQIMHPDDQEEHLIAWKAAFESGSDFLFEHRFRNAAGAYRWQLSRALPQFDAAGSIQMWVGTSTDIHEMKEQDEQRELFISMASHELKTPVTSIKGYVQLMRTMYSSSGDPFLRTSLDTINNQIIKLTNLITDLLDLSKIKTGNLLFHPEEFEISKLAEDVVSELRYINRDHHFNLVAEAPVTVCADKERIGQVLINFLTNAIKYSPGSNEINIRISTNKENQVLLSVEDFGIGVNEKDHAKIFERFYRVEGKSEKTFPGFGIALFISAEIMRAHNGRIGITSKPGKGSVFYFSLPLK